MCHTSDVFWVWWPFVTWNSPISTFDLSFTWNVTSCWKFRGRFKTVSSTAFEHRVARLAAISRSRVRHGASDAPQPMEGQFDSLFWQFDSLCTAPPLSSICCRLMWSHWTGLASRIRWRGVCPDLAAGRVCVCVCALSVYCMSMSVIPLLWVCRVVLMSVGTHFYLYLPILT